MAKLKKSYRLDEDTVARIDDISRRVGVSQAEAVAVAVAAYVDVRAGGAPPDVGPAAAPPAPPASAVEALADQLAVKDRQIQTLGEALKAAQALNAASIGRSLPGPTEEEARARVEAAVAAERERIRALPALDRLRGRI